MALISNGMSTLDSYLHDQKYYIPDYQRGYAWVEDQLEDFWQDLENCLSHERHHFFGQIVIHNDTEVDKYYIIDGQQRTTTAVILLAVLRDKFSLFKDKNEDAENAYEDIRGQHIGRWSSSSDNLKLHLSGNDHDYFRNNIQRSSPNEPGNSPSQKRLYKAYMFFNEKIDASLAPFLDDVEETVAHLKLYFETLIRYFDVMRIVTDDINEAFILFETLNSRGKDLETADLLKNYVFMQAGINIETIKNKWVSMLETLSQKDDATKFIRYYWNSTHTFTREKNLYKAISQEITASKCESFVSDLEALAELYNTLSKPEDNKFFNDNEITSLLINLQTMKITSYYPIIFAMQLRRYDESAIKKVLSALEVLVFRNFVVAQKSGNKYEVLFANIAKQITDSYVPDEKIVNLIIDEANNDEVFKNDLQGLSIKTVTIAKYILREIEDFGNPEKHTSKDNKVINLEHIMPKSNAQWQIDDDIHAKYLYRLSNQTLLLDEYNRAISNKPFENKKEMYSQSKIAMTKRLAAYATWSPSEMDDREAKLNDVILQRWALPNL